MLEKAGLSCYYLCWIILTINSIPLVRYARILAYIDYSAFTGCSTLVELILPNALKEIGVGAFRSCKNLETITLLEGLETIDNSAFGYCSSLKTDKLPDSLSNIGRDIFGGHYDNIPASEAVWPRAGIPKDSAMFPSGLMLLPLAPDSIFQ